MAERRTKRQLEIERRDAELRRMLGAQFRQQRRTRGSRSERSRADALLGGSDVPLLMTGVPPPPVSRLLILRVSAANRQLAADFRKTSRAASRGFLEGIDSVVAERTIVGREAFRPGRGPARIGRSRALPGNKHHRPVGAHRFATGSNPMADDGIGACQETP